jgi:hypothetical protein
MDREKNINYDGVREIIKYELSKSMIPDKIFNKKCVELMDRFLECNGKLLSCIYQSILKNSENSITKKEFKKKLDNFMTFDMPVLRVNRNYQLNYIVTFMKMMELGEFRTTDTEEITQESIEKALSDFSEFDYFIFITCDIPFSKLWLFASENKTIVIKYIDQLYKISRIIYDSHVVRRKYDILFTDTKIPCIIYDSKLHGKSSIIKTIVNESINKNKAIKDKIYRDEVIDTANKVINRVVQSMVKHDVTSDADLNFREHGVSKNILDSITEANKVLQEDIKKGRISIDTLTDVGVSLLSTYKENPEVSKSLPEFQAICCYVVQALEQSKKMGQQLNPNAEKIYRILKDTFYDPNFKINPTIRRALDAQRNVIKNKMKHRKK